MKIMSELSISELSIFCISNKKIWIVLVILRWIVHSTKKSISHQKTFVESLAGLLPQWQTFIRVVHVVRFYFFAPKRS